MMRRSILSLLATLIGLGAAAASACTNGNGIETPSPPVDLVLRDVTVFDVRDRVALAGRTVVIDDGRISAVLAAGADVPAARRSIQGRGRALAHASSVSRRAGIVASSRIVPSCALTQKLIVFLWMSNPI